MLIPAIAPLHYWCESKIHWYYQWHHFRYATVIHIVALIIAVVSTVLYVFAYNTPSIHASAITWDGGGTDGTCGGSAGDGNKWSCATNWSTDTIPIAGDTVTFNSTSVKNATVDASFTNTIATLTIASGYTGTITQATTLHLTTNFSQAAGTFTSAAQSLVIDASFIISAGTFTASSGTMNIGGAMTVTGSPTFNHNSGTITFDTATSATLSCGSIVFNLVTFNNSGPKTVSANCSMPLGLNPTLAGSSNIVLVGTLSGTGTLNKTSGTLTMNAGSAISGFSALNLNNFTRTGGTVTGASSLTLAGTYTINGATVDLSSYTTVDLNGGFTFSSGSFTAPSGSMTVAGNITFSGAGTFNANGGTITFDGAGSTLTCNNVTFATVVFNHSGTKTINSDCTLPLGLNPTLAGTGNIVTSGAFTGTGTLTKTSFAVTMNTSSAISGFSAISIGGAFTLSGGTISTATSLIVGGNFTLSGATYNMGSYTTADFNSSFIFSSGAFTAPSGVMTVASTFTISGTAAFTANGGTVTFDGSSGTITCNNATFNLVSFTHIVTKTVSSSCSLPLGDNPTSTAADIVLDGTISGTGTWTRTTAAAKVTLDVGSSLTGFTGLSMPKLTIAGATFDASNYTTFTISTAFTLSSGTFTAPSGTATLPGAITVTGGTFNANGGTVAIGLTAGTMACNNIVFNRVSINVSGGLTVGSDCQLPLGANPTIAGAGNLTLNGTLSGTGTVIKANNLLRLNAGSLLSGFTGLVVGSGDSLLIAGGTLDASNYSPFSISSTLTMSSGSFTAPTGTMTVGGSFIVTGGTFISSGGALVLNGTDQSLFGTISLGSLTKTVTNAATLTFLEGSTITVTKGLTLTGSGPDVSQLLSLRSTTVGTQWLIDPQASRTLSYIDVKDSINSNATAISAGSCGCINSGNNTNWDFTPPAPTPSPTPTPTPTPTAPPDSSSPTATPTVEPTATLSPTPIALMSANLGLTKIGTTILKSPTISFIYVSQAARPLFGGTGTALGKVTIMADDKQICQTVVGPDGKWQCRSSLLAAGRYIVVISLITIDNQSTNLPPFAFTVSPRSVPVDQASPISSAKPSPVGSASSAALVSPSLTIVGNQPSDSPTPKSSVVSDRLALVWSWLVWVLSVTLVSLIVIASYIYWLDRYKKK